MKRAPKIVVSLLGVLALVTGAAWTWFFLGVPAEAVAASTAPLPPAAAVPGASAERYPKQGESQCGAYSLAEGLRVLTGATVTGAELVPVVMQQFSWSDTLTGTMPWKIAEEARRRGIPAVEHTARAADPGARLDVLRRHLAAGRPVVLLYESERGSQHFVLAVGYTSEGFQLYDPNFRVPISDMSKTVDENGPEVVGNRTMPSDELLTRWSKGGIAGLYTWWYVPLGK